MPTAGLKTTFPVAYVFRHKDRNVTKLKGHINKQQAMLVGVFEQASALVSANCSPAFPVRPCDYSVDAQKIVTAYLQVFFVQYYSWEILLLGKRF
jgi:hypothetical protein